MSKTGIKLADKPFPMTKNPGVLIEFDDGHKCMARPDQIQEMVQ